MLLELLSYSDSRIRTIFHAQSKRVFGHPGKAWFPYGRYRSLSVVDGLSRSFEYLGRRESLPVLSGLSGSLSVFHGR